jgi:hypothetical protein
MVAMPMGKGGFYSLAGIITACGCGERICAAVVGIGLCPSYSSLLLPYHGNAIDHMPAEIIWEERGVRRNYSGVVTATEFLESIFAVQRDPRFDSLAYSILDALDVTGTDVSDFDIKSVAAHSIGALNSNASVKVAILASDPTVLAMAQIFLSPPYSSYPAEILSTRQAADAWILAALAA